MPPSQATNSVHARQLLRFQQTGHPFTELIQPSDIALAEALAVKNPSTYSEDDYPLNWVESRRQFTTFLKRWRFLQSPTSTSQTTRTSQAEAESSYISHLPSSSQQPDGLGKPSSQRTENTGQSLEGSSVSHQLPHISHFPTSASISKDAKLPLQGRLVQVPPTLTSPLKRRHNTGIFNLPGTFPNIFGISAPKAPAIPDEAADTQLPTSSSSLSSLEADTPALTNTTTTTAKSATAKTDKSTVKAIFAKLLSTAKSTTMAALTSDEAQRLMQNALDQQNEQYNQNIAAFLAA